jgi:hypothetical protein
MGCPLAATRPHVPSVPSNTIRALPIVFIFRRLTLSVRALRFLLAGAVVIGSVIPCAAQVTPAQTITPPDDTPSIRIGAVIFTDFTIQTEPKITDVDGNQVDLSSFNIGRAYLNVTGNINHRIAFRITPDITRETSTGPAVSGSYVYRLKYAYVQFNLDDWMTRGSWARLGMQQTPWVDFEEGVYRYRFQGTVFSEREGFLSSSDVGASFHYNFARNYGEVHAGFYNGDNYNRFETNDEKAFEIRGTFRPLPMSPILRGLRFTGFYDHDAYVKDAERRRGIFAVTFEHPHVNAAFQYLSTADQPRAAAVKVDAKGYSIWVTPRATNGIEGLLRFDHLEPNDDLPGKRDRIIGGVAYWFPHQGTVSTALLFDIENVDNHDFVSARADERRYALHALVSF